MANNAMTGIEGNPGLYVFVRIWLAWISRMLLWMVVITAAVAIFAIFVSVILTGFSFTFDIDKGRFIAVSSFLGMALGMIGGTLAWVQSLRSILGKKYAGYRLVLVRDKDR